MKMEILENVTVQSSLLPSSLTRAVFADWGQLGGTVWLLLHSVNTLPLMRRPTTIRLISIFRFDGENCAKLQL